MTLLVFVKTNRYVTTSLAPNGFRGTLTLLATTTFGTPTGFVTIVVTGTPRVIEQIKTQLDRMVPVQKVRDLTTTGPFVDRELALVQVKSEGDQRIEALRIADIFRARVVDSTLDSFIFEVTGTAGKIDAFVNLMRPLGLADVSRTGVAALSRGKMKKEIKKGE